MKKIGFTFLFLIGLVDFLSGQTTPENAILLLNSGRMDVQTSFYWQLLSDNGQSLGFKSPGVWDVWSNPASLISFKRPYISLALKPGFRIDPANFYDVDGTIKRKMDNSIADYKTSATEVAYPQLSSSIGQKGGLFGFQLVYPVHGGVFAFEMGQPLFLSLNARNNGLATLIETRKSVGSRDMIIHLRIDALLQADLQLKASTYKLNYVRKVNEKLAVGGGVSKTKISAYFNGSANLNGIMETAGTEYVFNDPYDKRIDFDAGETNKLDQAAFLDFNGGGWDFHFGALYHAARSVVIGASYSRSAPVTLKGDMSVIQYKIPALNADALLSDDPNAELVEPTKLNLAKLTLTEPVENPVGDRIKINFPSSFGLQFSYQSLFFESTISLQKYFNRFGYDFLQDERYAELNYGLNLDLCFGTVKLSIGAIKGNIVHKKHGKIQSSSGIWVPHTSLEFAIFILRNYHFSSKLFASPTPGVGVKLGYFF